MSGTVSVKPNPIQRNSADVATELTQLYFRDKSVGDLEEITNVYTKIYSIAEVCRIENRDMAMLSYSKVKDLLK